MILTVNATGDTVSVKRRLEGRERSLFGGDFSPDTGVHEISFRDGASSTLELRAKGTDGRPGTDHAPSDGTVPVQAMPEPWRLSLMPCPAMQRDDQ